MTATITHVRTTTMPDGSVYLDFRSGEPVQDWDSRFLMQLYVNKLKDVREVLAALGFKEDRGDRTAYGRRVHRLWVRP